MTIETTTLCKLRFIGEIVETYRGTEQCFAKVAVRHICIEIPSTDCAAISLGEIIAFEAGIAAQGCRQVPSHGPDGIGVPEYQEQS